MSKWGSRKASVVLAALKRIGWKELRQSGSHKTLARDGFANYTWAFHDGDEIGPKMMKRIARDTGLTPDDV